MKRGLDFFCKLEEFITGEVAANTLLEVTPGLLEVANILLKGMDRSVALPDLIRIVGFFCKREESFSVEVATVLLEVAAVLLKMVVVVLEVANVLLKGMSRLVVLPILTIGLGFFLFKLEDFISVEVANVLLELADVLLKMLDVVHEVANVLLKGMG